MSAFDRQRQRELNIGKTFINFNAIGMDSAKFGNEAHFMCFAAIVTPRKGRQRPRISISETLRLPVLKCKATGW